DRHGRGDGAGDYALARLELAAVVGQEVGHVADDVGRVAGGRGGAGARLLRLPAHDRGLDALEVGAGGVGGAEDEGAMEDVAGQDRIQVLEGGAASTTSIA